MSTVVKSLIFKTFQLLDRTILRFTPSSIVSRSGVDVLVPGDALYDHEIGT